MIEERLQRAYVTALRRSHDSCRVEIHLGQDIIDYLMSLMPHEGEGSTAWGFPVVVNFGQPDHISVHAVDIIY